MEAAKRSEQAWKGTTGGGNGGQRMLILLLRRLDTRFLYGILFLIIPFYMLFPGKGTRAIYHYFRRHVGLSRGPALRGTLRNHLKFGQVILDRFSLFAGRKKDFHVEIVGNEHFERLANGDKGFVIAGSHVGNFEITGYMLSSRKKRMNALVYAGETETMQKNRMHILENSNIRIIPVLPDLSHLFHMNAALQEGEIVSMTCDRSHGSSKNVECLFLGGKADFPLGAFALAEKFALEVLAIFTIKISAKKYRIYVIPIPVEGKDSPHLDRKLKIAHAVNQYVAELEKIVKRYPEQWFNYYEFWKK